MSGGMHNIPSLPISSKPVAALIVKHLIVSVPFLFSDCSLFYHLLTFWGLYWLEPSPWMSESLPMRGYLRTVPVPDFHYAPITLKTLHVYGETCRGGCSLIFISYSSACLRLYSWLYLCEDSGNRFIGTTVLPFGGRLALNRASVPSKLRKQTGEFWSF